MRFYTASVNSGQTIAARKSGIVRYAPLATKMMGAANAAMCPQYQTSRFAVERIAAAMIPGPK
jgi:hypothetical protein